MKRKIFTFFAALAIFLGTAQPIPVAAQSLAQAAPLSQQTADSAMSQLELATAELVNRQRASYGLDPLTISVSLSAKARIKAQDMHANGYFSHTSPRYGSPFSMMRTLGISYTSAAENIAMGYKTAQAVVSAWMASPSHRANILSERYTEMGIGYVDGYWAQWFLTP